MPFSAKRRKRAELKRLLLFHNFWSPKTAFALKKADLEHLMRVTCYTHRLMGRPVFRGLWPGRPPAIPGGRGTAAALYLRPRTPIRVCTGAKCGMCGVRECMNAYHVSAEWRACDPGSI